MPEMVAQVTQEQMRSLEDRVLKLEGAHDTLSDRHEEFREEMKTEVKSLHAAVQGVNNRLDLAVTGMGELKSMLKTANDDRTAKDQALRLTVWAANTLGPYLLIVLVALAAYLKGHL